MKKIIFILILLLVGMEGVGWWVYQKSKNAKNSVYNEQGSEVKLSQESEPAKQNNEKESNGQQFDDLLKSNFDPTSFPPPAVETVDGVVQRTIHMGVRQWAWDPSGIQANYGEKVILIMHNADVAHSISIPELNIRQEIPEEGAVVMFNANKRGTFEFACDIPCGSGHSQMKGKITIS